MLPLGEFRRKAAGLADLLNWSNLVAPGVVLCKDGMLLAGFAYAGPDIASRTEGDRNAVCERINAALMRLGSGWATWVDAVRIPTGDYPAPERSHFPDPFSRAVDEERRRQFQAEGVHYEGEYVIVLGYLPPLRSRGRIVDLMYDDDSAAETSPASRILVQFEKDLATFRNAVGDAVRMRRMGDDSELDGHGRHHHRDELVNYLKGLITGSFGPVNIPSGGSYLDCVLAGREFHPGDQVKVGRDFVACVAVEGFPSESYPQILEAVDHIAAPLRFSTRLLHLDQHEMLTEMKKYRRHWKQRQRGFVSQLLRSHAKPGEALDDHAALMVAECDDAIREINSNDVAGGFYTANVVLRDADRVRLARTADHAAKVIERLGFVTRVETVNTTEAWLGSLPGHTAPNIRRPPMLTDRVADMLPLTSVWTGDDVCLNPLYPPGSPPLMHTATTGATPFRLNLKGHILGFGPTGAGKSTLEAMYALQARRYGGMRVVSFDYKRSMMVTAKVCGGRHYDLGAEGSPQLCPFAVLDTDGDVAWAFDYAAICFELQQHRKPDPVEKDAITSALRLMRQPGEGRSITHFQAQCQNEAVKEAMQFYTVMGPAGVLLDAEEDGIQDSDFNVYEMEDLLGRGEATVIPVLLALFRRFERGLTGRPALLDLQEAWVLLGHPVFRHKIYEWLRTMRSKNVTVMLWTQSLQEVMESGMLAVLTESCPNTIYLPNVDAFVRGTDRHPGPYDFYKAKGLNDVQIAIINGAEYKKHYYIVTPDGSRLFDLGLGALALRLAGATSKPDADRYNELERIHGADTPRAWLREGGVDVDALLASSAIPARERFLVYEPIQSDV